MESFEIKAKEEGREAFRPWADPHERCPYALSRCLATHLKYLCWHRGWKEAKWDYEDKQMESAN